jgi:O-antigen/teichoic acid export membrane protein
MSFGTQVLRGSLFSYGSYIVSKLLVYLSTLVLARLLAPHDFGLIGYAILLIGFLDVIKDLGVNAALIYRQDIKDEDAGQTFTLSVTSGVLCCCACWVLGPLAAAFFRDPHVTDVTRVLGFGFVFSGLGGVHGALLMKRMRFGRGFLPDLLQSLVKGVISVALALHGAGYWSLVWGQMAGMASLMLANWALYPWIPRITFHWASARPLLAYGLHYSLVALLGTLTGNVDYAIVGRTLGSTSLGLYTLAYSLPQMLTIGLTVALAKVMFPAYASLQGDREALRRGYLNVLHYSALVLVPLGIGLCAVTPAFIHTLYKPAWWPAVPAMQALSLYATIYAVGWNAGDIYKATGRPDILWKLAIVQAMVLVPALILGVKLGGIVGVAVAQVVVIVPYSVVRFWLIRRILAVTYVKIVAALRVPVLAGVVLYSVCLVLSRLPVAQTTPATVLALQTLFGGAAYLGVVLALDSTVRPAVRLPSRVRERTV